MVLDAQIIRGIVVIDIIVVIGQGSLGKVIARRSHAAMMVARELFGE
jgi:hypothetical protein